MSGGASTGSGAAARIADPHSSLPPTSTPPPSTAPSAMPAHSSLRTHHLSLGSEMAGGAVGRRLHLLVALDAIRHVQRTHLGDLPHIVYVAVAGCARDACLDVRLMGKAH